MTLQTPEEWRGRFVGALDILFFIHQQVQLGTGIEVFTGVVDAHAFCAFEQGVLEALGNNGHADAEFGRFGNWLRVVKKEYPGEGWPAKYLADFNGDHDKAIRKFLGFVAEFVELRQRDTQRGEQQPHEPLASRPWKFDDN